MDILRFRVFWATSLQSHYIMRRSLSRSSKKGNPQGYFAHRLRHRIIVRMKREILGPLELTFLHAYMNSLQCTVILFIAIRPLASQFGFFFFISWYVNYMRGGIFLVTCYVDLKACFFCCTAKRSSTVNGESILPTMAVTEDLHTLTHKAEEKSRWLQRMQAQIPSPAAVTPEVKNTRPRCQKKAGCRKVKVRKSSERV